MIMCYKGDETPKPEWLLVVFSLRCEQKRLTSCRHAFIPAVVCLLRSLAVCTAGPCGMNAPCGGITKVSREQPRSPCLLWCHVHDSPAAGADEGARMRVCGRGGGCVCERVAMNYFCPERSEGVGIILITFNCLSYVMLSPPKYASHSTVVSF